MFLFFLAARSLFLFFFFFFFFQVAEINKASKEGALFSVFGSGTGGSSSSRTKSESPAEEDFLPASQVYSVSEHRWDR